MSSPSAANGTGPFPMTVTLAALSVDNGMILKKIFVK
jgi:hypothetical protein